MPAGHMGRGVVNAAASIGQNTWSGSPRAERIASVGWVNGAPKVGWHDYSKQAMLSFPDDCTPVSASSGYTVLAHGKFWFLRPELPAAHRRRFPKSCIVPARDDAETIGPFASAGTQDYEDLSASTRSTTIQTDGPGHGRRGY